MLRRRVHNFDPSARMRNLSGRSVLRLACALGLLLFSLLSFVFFAHQSQHAAAASNPPAIGINLDEVSDYSADILFADAMKTYRLNAAPGQTNPPSLDSNGWPQGDFQAFLWDGGALHATQGTYGLRFNGKANVGLALTNGSINNQSYDAGSNTTTASVVITSDSSAALNFTNTQRTASSATNTGITNVQLMRPTSYQSSTSYSFSTTFTSPIKQLISNFQVIRFMDYSATNSNGQVNWSDRRLPQENQEGPAHNSNTYGWEGLGGAWEYAVQLCNETGKDAYIDIPEMATGSSPSDTSSYIYKLAQLIKYGSDASGNVYTSTQSNPVHPPLNTNLHLYIEYSNEVWNFGGAFDQSRQNYNAAQSEVSAGSPLNYDGETNTYYWGWRRTAKRIVETSNIFRAVFGDGAMPPNSNPMIRPVLEWQYDNLQDTAHQELSFVNGYYNNGDGKQHVSNPHPPTYFLWGAGGASYFNSNNDSATTVDALFASGIPGSGYQNMIQVEAQWAHQYNLHDVAYEGGWGITGTVAENAKLDSRAKQAYIDAQNQFTAAGGELNMYFDAAGGDYAMAYGLYNGQYSPDITAQTSPAMQAIYAINQSSVNTTPTPTPTPIPTNQANIANAATAPTIDGNSNDAVWGSASSYALNNVVGSPSGFSASYQAAWDSSNLYFLVKVQDSSYSSHADMIEAYIDPNNDRGSGYDTLDMQYQFPSNSTTVTQYNGGQPGTNTAGIVFANLTVSGGYQVEIKIPWSTLKVTPAAGNQIGLDMDAWQNTGSGKNKLFWNATSDNDWTNPSLFGQGTLQAGGSPTPTPTPSPTATPSPTPTGGGSLPSPWQTQDIGSVGQSGSASYSNGTFTVAGSGSDIWGGSDQFRYVYQALNGDGSIVARVTGQQNTDQWAKSGVMIRETLNNNSAFADMVITPGNGANFQDRTSTGGNAVAATSVSASVPYWVKLTRSGTTITGSISSDGTNWTQVGSNTFSMASSVTIGLAVTAHNNSVLNTSTFSNVSVTGGWQNQDIGSVGLAGSYSFNGSTYTVNGSGADIWGGSDQFQYVYQTLSGDATIVAKVTGEQNTDPWAKAGVMIRQSTDPGSVNVAALVTPGNGVVAQWRSSSYNGSSQAVGPNATAPYWVKLVRSGNTFTAYASSDGSNWTQITQQTVSMTGSVLIGLAVTSHNNTALNTSTFSNVSITQP